MLYPKCALIGNDKQGVKKDYVLSVSILESWLVSNIMPKQWSGTGLEDIFSLCTPLCFFKFLSEIYFLKFIEIYFYYSRGKK